MNAWIVGNNLIKHHNLIKMYNEFYLQDITDENYTHAQKVFEEPNLEKP